MLLIKELSTETTLDKSEMKQLAGGVNIVDANMRTRYVAVQQKASNTNAYGKWNVLVLGLKHFGLAG
jgi:hypothetical protein